MNCALVTGGSRGIGRAVCIKLAEQGYHILINYKGNTAAAEETLTAVKAKGVEGELLKFDVGNFEEVQTVLGGWIENNKEKQIEVLVNNAGIREDMMMFQMSNAQWKGVLNASLDGFFYVTKQVLTGMLIKRYGRIINIISTSVKIPLKNLGVSNTIRGAVASWAKTMANELGQFNITVNNVLPGFTATQRLSALVENIAKRGNTVVDIVEKNMREEVPMKRFADAAEIAAVAAFLASPAASYVNGTSIPVDGGRTGAI